jgi:hypothetical protein
VIDGKPTTHRDGRGPDWCIYSVDLSAGRGRTVEVGFAMADAGRPFSRPAMTADVWLVMDRSVPAPAAPSDKCLPLQIAQTRRRQTIQLLGDARIAGRDLSRSIGDQNVKEAPAGKLRILVFDSNAEPRFRDKFIMLNGIRLAPVPVNARSLSAWEEHVVDIPVDHLARIRKVNSVQVTNAAGDYFKFTGLALAVRLSDGRWVETRPHDQVYSSAAKWHYAEGTVFSGRRSGVIELSFD